LQGRSTDVDDFAPPSDEPKINNRKLVPCRICLAIFGRVRLTMRYCAKCGRAFCEGEHGTFRPAPRSRAQGYCVRCFADSTGQLSSN
jgi:hypothetical protein